MYHDHQPDAECRSPILCTKLWGIINKILRTVLPLLASPDNKGTIEVAGTNIVMLVIAHYKDNNVHVSSLETYSL